MFINVQRILYLVFLINIFRFYPELLPGALGTFFGGRLTDIIIVLILTLLLFIKYSTVRFYDFLLLLGIPIFVLIILYGLSFLNGISMGYKFTTFSLVEFFRYSLTGIIGLTFLTYGNYVNNNFINKFWQYAIIANLIFNVALLFLPGFQLIADMFISSKTKLSVLNASGDASSYVLRSSGLFINPNWAGLFFNFALLYFILSPKNILKMNELKRYFFILITLICIFMAGSRTAIILTIVVAILSFLFRFKLWSIPIIFFTILFAQFINLEPLNWHFLPIHYRQLLNGIFIYGDLSAIGSFGDRLTLWKDIYENYVLLSPFLGFGVTDSIGIADNQYVWMLASYGFIGTTLIFLYFLILLISMFLQSFIQKVKLFM